MQYKFIIPLALLMAGTVHAQLTFLSDNRSVSVSGSVQDMNGNVIQSYGQTNQPSAPFADFNSQAQGGFQSASSSASQNSTLSFNSISSVGGVSASVATGMFGSGFEANAQASSAFEVSFGIQQPVTFSLSGYRDIESMNGVIDFELNSANHGNIVSWSGPTLNNNNLNVSGLLQPDVYTLDVQEYFSFMSVGNSQDAGNMNYTMVFSVPEPAAIGPFLILTWFGITALKRKLAKV